MINWIKNLFKYRPKFKVGDIIISNSNEGETWEKDISLEYKILAVGKNKYLVRPMWTSKDMYNSAYSFDYFDRNFRINNES